MFWSKLPRHKSHTHAHPIYRKEEKQRAPQRVTLTPKRRPEKAGMTRRHLPLGIPGLLAWLCGVPRTRGPLPSIFSFFAAHAQKTKPPLFCVEGQRHLARPKGRSGPTQSQPGLTRGCTVASPASTRAKIWPAAAGGRPPGKKSPNDTIFCEVLEAKITLKQS